MAKTIEIGPKEVYFQGGVLYAEFETRTYTFTPDKPITSKGDKQECGNAFVAGIMMLSYTNQVEDKMSELGYPGKINIINKK